MLSETRRGLGRKRCAIFSIYLRRDKMTLSLIRVVRASFVLVAIPFLFTAPLRAQGDAASLYKTKCGVCHAPDGSGSTSMGKQMQTPDLRSDEVQKQTEAQLIDAITSGKGKKMPAYKGKLTDDQIMQLASYIRSWAKKK
jgi:mono/diheme cytochrome c family protein